MTPLRGLTDPVGPESPQIYWVRRLVLLIAAVVVVALVIAGIAKLVGGVERVGCSGGFVVHSGPVVDGHCVGVGDSFSKFIRSEPK